MTAVHSTAEFCRYTVSANQGRFVTDPVRLAALFREYANIETTPDFRKIVELIRGWVSNPVSKVFRYWRREYVSEWDLAYSLCCQRQTGDTKFDVLHELLKSFIRA